MINTKFFKIQHFELKLIIFSVLFLFILKLFFSNNYLAILINSIIELAFFLIIYCLLFALETISSKNRIYNLTKKSIFYLLIIFNLFIFSINSIFLNESILMKYTITNFNFGAFKFLFTNIIPLKYITAIPIAIALIFFLSKLNFNSLEKINPSLKKLILLIIIISLFAFFFKYSLVSNIYANTLHESIFEKSQKEINLNDSSLANTTYASNLFNKQILDYSNSKLSENQKVLVFVMEQTSYNTFINDLKKIPKERNFFEKVKKHSNIFTNFYTTNQDSMTSVWTMLSSQFMPFEAYSTNCNKYCWNTPKSTNLVTLFNNNNYKTYALTAVYAVNSIVAVYNWNKDISLGKSFPNTQFFCPKEFEYEPGCEDNILLDELKNITKSNENNGLFLLQEFIYGHGEIYMSTFNKTRIEYYNDYLLNFYEFLEQQNLLENTTIIILADHGEKGYYEKELWNYQIPFIIINKNLKYKEIDSLYSTIDFKDILLSYLENKEPQKEENPVFFVGQSSSSEIGYIDKKGNYFMGKAKDNSLKIKQTRGMTNEQIEIAFKLFRKYQKDIISKSTR